MDGLDLIIFDCDGVLVDSEIIAAEVEAKLLTEAGYPIQAGELAERFAGLTWKDILLAVEREASIPLQASLLDRSEKLLDDKLAKSVKSIEGVAAALARIDLPRCICSNSSSHRLDAMLKRTRLISYFEPNIFSAKSLGEGRTKPKPDIFLHAAEAMKADPARTIVIEDSVHGIHGASSAGMRVIGFTGASHSYPAHASKLMEAGAQTVIARMSELPATVAALATWQEAI
ncbi:HAD family hydrolase [Pararhizobium haloflavum]|uniref:HAD family hydrolase n=1 Tax=Pararhizobium haloflavum TaxID=2037914 RepID=UPI000C1A074A|nr:HAD family hydrolase [Pararhizobium haloflavum]